MKVLYSVLITLVFSGSLYSQENENIVSAFITNEKTIAVKFSNQIVTNDIQIISGGESLTVSDIQEIKSKEYRLTVNRTLDFTKNMW